MINIAKITVKIVDENDADIKGAKVVFGSFIGADTRKVNSVEGNSDEKGFFTGTLEATNSVTISAQKEGYYGSDLHYTFKGVKTKRWEPWNPVLKVVLKRIINPVPMYARDTRKSPIQIPVIGKAAGFDLTAFDWIKPYGKGNHADMFFKVEKRLTAWNNFESKLTVSFPNKFDGIQLVKDDRKFGSALVLSRFAPEDGYVQKLSHFMNQNPGEPRKDDFKDDNNYYIRVRSEVKNGKIVRAMYGKMYGDIVFDPRISTAQIIFKYYLNPDYTRNLEFDSRHNLFKDLKPSEQVGIF